MRRFEVQYQILDLNTNDQIIPAGFCAADIRITATGDVGNGRLERAVLSQNESGSPSAGSSPVSEAANLETDLSPVAADGSSGLHRPFRRGITAPAPNNTHPANGLLAPNGLTIDRVAPICLTQSDQSEPNGWYGLYSFNFVSGTTITLGTITITAAFLPDAATTNQFAFFTDGEPAPRASPNGANGSATVAVVPGSGTAALVAIAVLWEGRRRRRCR